MAKKIINLYILITFLFSLTEAFFFAVYTVFLISRGMDLFEVNLVNAFFMLSVFALEIPTGALADHFGRKKSVVLSCFIFSLATLIYYFSGSFWMFVLAEFVAAISVTFSSGAFEAWAVDSLKHHKFRGNMKHVFKREKQFHQLGIILGSLIGAYIGKIDIALPWLVSSVSTFGVGIFCWLKMKEDYFIPQKLKFEILPLKKIARDSIAYGWKNKAILYIIVFGTILFFSSQAFNMQWQVVFTDNFDMDVPMLGWIFVAISLFIMLGNQLSSWFARFIGKEKDAIILSQVVTVLGMIAASMMTNLGVALVGFFIHEMGRGMMAPLKQAYMNHRIPSDKRATVLSFDSMLVKGGGVLGLIVSGYLAKNYSISLAWLVSGIVLAISIPLFLKIKNGE